MNKFLQRFLVVSQGLHYEGEGDGGDGTGGSGGRYSDSFPEDVRSWDEVKNSETPEAFWQQISSHRQHLGQSIRIPGPDAGKEDWDAFNSKLVDKVPTLMHTPNPEDPESLNQIYGRLGRPADAAGYTTPEFKNNEGAVVSPFSAPEMETLKKHAHQAGLTQKQFTELVNTQSGALIEATQAQSASLKAEQEKLSTEWGAAEDRNYTILKNFATKTDAPEAIKSAIADKSLDADTAKWMLQAANASFGDSNRGINDDSGGNPGVMTPAEAGVARTEIMNNKQHPYWNKMDPGHQAAIARVRELIILQNPTTATLPAPGTTFNIGGDQSAVGGK